jgi:hypothetical protein
LKILKWKQEAVIVRETDNTMTTGKITQRQTMGYKKLHRKLMIEQKMYPTKNRR